MGWMDLRVVLGIEHLTVLIILWYASNFACLRSKQLHYFMTFAETAQVYGKANFSYKVPIIITMSQIVPLIYSKLGSQKVTPFNFHLK